MMENTKQLKKELLEEKAMGEYYRQFKRMKDAGVSKFVFDVKQYNKETGLLIKGANTKLYEFIDDTTLKKEMRYDLGAGRKNRICVTIIIKYERGLPYTLNYTKTCNGEIIEKYKERYIHSPLTPGYMEDEDMFTVRKIRDNGEMDIDQYIALEKENTVMIYSISINNKMRAPRINSQEYDLNMNCIGSCLNDGIWFNREYDDKGRLISMNRRTNKTNLSIITTDIFTYEDIPEGGYIERYYTAPIGSDLNDTDLSNLDKEACLTSTITYKNINGIDFEVFEIRNHERYTTKTERTYTYYDKDGNEIIF